MQALHWEGAKANESKRILYQLLSPVALGTVVVQQQVHNLIALCLHGRISHVMLEENSPRPLSFCGKAFSSMRILGAILGCKVYLSNVLVISNDANDPRTSPHLKPVTTMSRKAKFPHGYQQCKCTTNCLKYTPKG
eukprot:1423474-Amphidinium_carterae.1